MSSIYIHIPYCKQKCSYCSFYYKISQKDKKEMINSLKKEIELRKHYLNNNTIETIYFGGGTPSILTESEISLLINTITENYTVINNAEISLECNPDDLTREKVQNLKKAGINRLSIGIQSFNDEDLKFMNRSHNSSQAIESVKLAKEIGFNNISIDLMYSLPKQSLEKWKKNLDIAFSLEIQHISAYSLTIEEKTKLKSLLKKGEFSELDDIASSEHFDLLMMEAEKNKFIQYEISNFGLNGFFSKHNSKYWQAGHYLGIGPSAHSYNGETRSWNVNSNTKYIQDISENKIECEEEILSNFQKYNDYIMTSLRTISGVNLNYIKQEYGENYLIYFNNELHKWIKSEHVFIEKEIVYLSKKGKYISDNICSDLFKVD
ncbi:MAG: radical SAM family heme chaperone HemW [Flavobacteriales bacterium]|nr:radical SAM family heme chaperone HemW [Flavobacteriales bacterium]